jgi:hypothetical protein
MDKEQFSCSKPVLAFTPGALSLGDNFGLSIDTFNYRSLTMAIAATITTGEVASIKFQESSDNNSVDAWADIPEGENLYYPGSFPLTGAGAKLVNVGCVAKERYVRVNIVCTGTVDIALSQALAQLQDSMFKPQVKEASVVADIDVRNPAPTGDAVTTAPKRT